MNTIRGDLAPFRTVLSTRDQQPVFDLERHCWRSTDLDADFAKTTSELAASDPDTGCNQCWRKQSVEARNPGSSAGLREQTSKKLRNSPRSSGAVFI